MKIDLATEPTKEIKLDAAQTSTAGLDKVEDGEKITLTANVKKDGELVTLTDVTVETAPIVDKPPGEEQTNEPETIASEGEQAAERMGIKPRKSKQLSPLEAGMED